LSFALKISILFTPLKKTGINQKKIK
jgi:hypothetical protein